MIGIFGIFIGFILLIIGMSCNNGNLTKVSLSMMFGAIIVIGVSIHFLDEIECQTVPTIISVDNEPDTNIKIDVCRNKPYNGQWGNWYQR